MTIHCPQKCSKHIPQEFIYRQNPIITWLAQPAMFDWRMVMGLISSLFNSYFRCVNCSNPSRLWAIFHTTWLSHCWIAKGTFQPCLIISWYMKSRYIRTDWWKKPPCPRNATPIFPCFPIVFQDFPIKTIKNFHLPWIFPRFPHDFPMFFSRFPGAEVDLAGNWKSALCFSIAMFRCQRPKQVPTLGVDA